MRAIPLVLALTLVAPIFTPGIAEAVRTAKRPDALLVTDLRTAIDLAVRSPSRAAPPSVLGGLTPAAVELDAQALGDLGAGASRARSSQEALALLAEIAGIASASSKPAKPTTDLASQFAALYRIEGRSFNDATRADLEGRLASLAPAAHATVEILLPAILEARRDVDKAFAGLPPSSRADLARDASRAVEAALALAQDPDDVAALATGTRYAALASRVDRAALLRAGLALDAGARAAGQTPPAVPCFAPRLEGANTGCVLFEDPLGLVIVTGGGPARVASEPVLAIDLGGSTDYANRAGGADASQGRYLSVIVDLGGRDVYGGSRDASVGTGLAGAGAVFDFGGEDDVYSGGLSSIAVSAAGLGLVIDDGGRNAFSACGLGEAASVSGLSLLVSGEGEDRFVLSSESRDARNCGPATGQSAGLLGGAAVLLDLGGENTYDAATSNFAQAGASLGVSALVDHGRPAFRARDLAQAAASAGLALLVATGDSTIERAYTASSRSQSYADLGGLSVLAAIGPSRASDAFRVERMGQAYSATGGAAVLFDAAGNDIFAAGTQAQAFGAAGAAVLANVGGVDAYSSGASNDATAEARGAPVSGAGGILLDVASLAGNDLATEAARRAFAKLDAFAARDAAGEVLRIPYAWDLPEPLSFEGLKLAEDEVPLVARTLANLANDGKNVFTLEDRAAFAFLSPPRCAEGTAHGVKGVDDPRWACPIPLSTTTSEAGPKPQPARAAAAEASTCGTTTGVGTFWGSTSESFAGWQVSGRWVLEANRPGRAGAALPAFHMGSPASPYRFGGGPEGYGLERISATLSSPPVCLPPAADGKAIALQFGKWHEVEQYSPAPKDVMQLRVCPATSDVSVPCGNLVRQWDSQQESSPEWTTNVVPLNAYAGETVRFQFAFDSVDGYNNMYEGWYLDDFNAYQGEPSKLLQMTLAESPWYETTVNGYPADERVSTTTFEYSDGRVEQAARTEQLIYIDVERLHTLHVDAYRDVDGTRSVRSFEREFLQNAAFDEPIRPYEHRALDQRAGAYGEPIVGRFYTWYRVTTRVDDRVETYVHLDAADPPLHDPSPPPTQSPPPGPVGDGDVNRDGYWLGLDIYAQYFCEGSHDRSARNVVDSAQWGCHDKLQAGVALFQLDRRFHNRAEVASLVGDLIEKFGEALAWLNEPGLKNFLKESLKIHWFGYFLAVAERGDVGGAYVEEIDYVSCFGACIGYGATVVSMHLPPTPWSPPVSVWQPYPGHWLTNDDPSAPWVWHYQAWSANGAANPRLAGPAPAPPELPPREAVFQEDWSDGLSGWYEDGLWHLSSRSGGRTAYFGVETTGTYDTGRAEMGCLVHDGEIVVPRANHGAVVEATFWQSHEPATGAEAHDLFTIDWRDSNGVWRPLTRYSSREGEDRDQGEWVTRTYEVPGNSRQQGTHGTLRFCVMTGDAYYNGYAGWHVGDVRVLAYQE